MVLPRKDGLAVLDHLRHRANRPRILVLSARNQVSDRISVLNMGADDYLAKPFSFDELLARLRALSRRPKAAKLLFLSMGAMSIYPLTRLVDVAGATPPRF
ncbi:response regulator [Rhodanobacter sp. ANJX3]|uniref:response regulator transcription factor n=1 Tax=Rhodanobacter sp. ANJX3 TaxID=2723083 RepID=UPI0031B88CD7